MLYFFLGGITGGLFRGRLAGPVWRRARSRRYLAGPHPGLPAPGAQHGLPGCRPRSAAALLAHGFPERAVAAADVQGVFADVIWLRDPGCIRSGRFPVVCGCRGGRRDGRLHAAENPVGKVISAIGAAGGLALAGYTGVLVNVTNLPVWGTSPWLGALFPVSVVPNGIAFLLLVARRYPSTTLEKLEEADNYMMVLESIALALFLLGLGVIGSRFILNNPPVLALFVVVVVVGLAVPFALRFVPHRPAVFAALSSVCVLVGGFVLRWAVLAAPQGVGL